MNTSEKDDIFARKAREVFLASAERLDPEVLAGLRAARARAVEAAGQPHARWQSYGWRLPAGAVALLFVAVVGGALLRNGGAGAPSVPAPFTVGGNDDEPVVFTSDSLDLYADQDFYQWMEIEDQPAAADDEPADDEDDGDDDDTGVGG